MLLVGLGGPTYLQALFERPCAEGGGGGTYGPGTATRKQTPIVFTRFSKKLSHDEHSCEFPAIFKRKQNRILGWGRYF